MLGRSYEEVNDNICANGYPDKDRFERGQVLPTCPVRENRHEIYRLIRLMN
jgi:hypothetical protein